MRRSTFLLGLLLIVPFLAGCVKTPPEGEGAAQIDDHDFDVSDDEGWNETGDRNASGNGTGGNTTGNETGNETGNGTDLPPQAMLQATPTNGTAPLNVTFTLDARDAENGTLSWELDWDGDGTADENGTTLPAEVNVTYEEAGNHTATLNVSGGNGSGEANVTIVVEEGGDGGDDGMCHRDASLTAAGYYVDVRGPTSVWLYRETNGVDGLQVGDPEFEEEEYLGCANPDTLVA